MNEPLTRIRWGSTDIKGPVHIYRERLILNRLSRYASRGAALDAGCGTGSFAISLARKGFLVFGIDLSMEGLRQLRQKAIAEGVSQVVTEVQSDVEVIPFRDNSFDVIVCGEVLEHLVDDKSAVTDFHRVLKPGGVCIVTVPANPALWSCCDEYAGHYRRYTKEGLINLFA